MSWLSEITQKLYMALASKGHPQHLCDCSDHPDWNGGWIRTDSSRYYNILGEHETDRDVLRSKPKSSCYDDETDLNNYNVFKTWQTNDSAIFDTLKIKFKGSGKQDAKFLVKSICIKQKGERDCINPKIKKIYGGAYKTEEKNSLIGSIIGNNDGLFSGGTTGIQVDGQYPFGGEIYIDIEEPILFKNIKSVEFDFYSDDDDTKISLDFSGAYRLFTTGELAIHNGHLYEALGKINDADDEPGKSIHWLWVCSCEDIIFPTPTPTPTPYVPPTPTPTPYIEPTPTPTPQCLCSEHETWIPTNYYKHESVVSYNGSLYMAHDYQGTEGDAQNSIADVPGKSNHWLWVCDCTDGTPIPFVCCRDHLNVFRTGPDETIVDGQNQITVGKQLYGGKLCIDSGTGDHCEGLVEEYTVYLPNDNPIGTIIFNGGINADPVLYLSIMDSEHAKTYGYPDLTGKCYRAEAKDGRFDLEEII